MKALFALLLLFAQPLHAQERFVAWAREHAIPLSDLQAVAPIVGGARVVALGEPAHGAHEPLALRNALFRFLVEQQGFTAIALESGLGESRRLQDYVAGGAGDVRQLVHDSLSWGFGRFEENVELIEWMHGYNADPAHERKIRFYGIDMSGGDKSGDWVGARITLDDKDAALAPFRDRFSLSGYASLSAAAKRRLHSAIAGSIRRAKDVWAQRDAVLAGQLEALFRVSRPADSGDDLMPGDYRADAVRDAAMADNLLWVLRQEGPSGRVLLFAHNGHVMNAPGRGGIWSVYRHAPRSMGQHLRAKLGGRLRIIITSAANIDPALPTEGQPDGSLDRALAETGRAPAILDLRPIEGAARDWLERDQSMRASVTTESVFVPRRAADAVAFLPSLSPTR